MKRIGIYVIYDRTGIIDPYIGQVLCELSKYLSRLIVVCNFPKAILGYEYAGKYADEVFFRKNIGFDAGAYKDKLLQMLEERELDKFDELLIANDSFYAPIYPFNNLFSRMEKEACDFWGITRYPGGTYEGTPLQTHVQSYFMVFKSKILHSIDFYMFWKNLDYPSSFVEAVFRFEIRINQYLLDKGYIGTAYTDIETSGHIIKFGEVPYRKYPLQLIQNAKVPVIKRKAFDFDNDGYVNALEALMHIDKNTNYDVNLIKNHLRRTSTHVTMSPSYNLLELEKFYYRFKNIYIYGAGGWGTNVAAYFKWKGWDFAGFLVTRCDDRVNVKEFDSTEITDEDGIIIAVGKKKIIQEIYINILKKCGDHQVFLPHFAL